MSYSVFIIYTTGEGLTFQMYTCVKIKINDNRDYKNKDKKD